MLARAALYAYAGQRIASRLPLPELSELPDSDDGGSPAFRIRLERLPTCAQRQDLLWRQDFLEAASQVTLTCARTPQGHLLEFPGVATIESTPQGDIRISPWPGASPESVRHVLLDQALPRLIAQRGDFTLHGAAIQLAPNRAIVVVGDSGMGKSTLASAFARAGIRVLTDDCLRVQVNGDSAQVIPTYSGLRLWPDSLAQLFPGHDTRSTPMADYSDKRRLTLASAMDPVALEAVYVLRSPHGNDIATERLSAQAACMALVRNSFQLDLGDSAHVGHMLRHAARVAETVPVHALSYPRDYARLPAVIDYLMRRT
jgi:hypothetical protein